MTRISLLLPAAVLCLAAAPATKPPPVKPAPPKAAPKAAATFDATNPQGLMDILGAAGAKAQTSRREADAVFVAVTSAVANFSMQFAGCNAQGRACRAVLLDQAMGRGNVSAAQVNAFNQTSVMCRLYQDRGGQNHVVYSAILFRTMTRADAETHLLAWQGCLADALDFQKDPAGYLVDAA
ncbi:hypothetical protein [uncultured Phenylobacterium sp.]|uniref:hypothetical protein n=1 Tax=uncultured Phenylobacterium sp. TaxID=349273 RepID=UPI0025D6DCBE|nr:hypothetical protein [uncultured Phenylobacterium sp.]